MVQTEERRIGVHAATHQDAAKGGCDRRERLAYEHVNLRFNPFGEIERCERADLAVVDVDEIVDRLNCGGFAVQFLGRRGRGKTTHMLAILARFPGASYAHIGEGERLTSLPQATPGGPVFLDELQRLPRKLRGRLFDGRTPLVLGTHWNYSRHLARAGYEVRTVRPARHLDAGVLREILKRRIEHARRGSGPLPAVGDETIDDLLRRHGDHVRGMENELYERFQELKGVCNV